MGNLMQVLPKLGVAGLIILAALMLILRTAYRAVRHHRRSR